MNVFGVVVPLWAVFLIGIILVVVAWKLIKFALTVLVVLILFFVILMCLDYFQVFDMIQGFLSGLL
jgi:hypothetical protein